MAVHRLTLATIGVPNVSDTIAYYTEFGLTPEADGWLATRDGGRQLRVVTAPTRRLVELQVGVDNPDDLDRIDGQMRRLDLPVKRDDTSLSAEEPVAGFRVTAEIAPRLTQPAAPAPACNGPGRIGRSGACAPGILRTDPVSPRKLGHLVVGSTDHEATMRFFIEGLGFKPSDYVNKRQAAFLRCSTDHHNVAVMGAPASFLHHTSWQVDDVDDVGRGAHAMLEDHPERHVWGLGRHYVGSNFFWYSRIRPGTSPSTTPRWTASLTTCSGRRRTLKAPAACSPGAHRPRRP